jgi:thioredoxin 1
MRAALDAPIRTSATVLERVLSTGHPALIVFETPDCEPCQALRPILDDLAREFHERVLIVRVTDASEGWLAARYHLSFVPTLLFCRDEVEHARIKGNPGQATIRAYLHYLLSELGRPDPAEGPRHTLAARFGAPAPEGARPRGLLFTGSAAPGS